MLVVFPISTIRRAAISACNVLRFVEVLGLHRPLPSPDGCKPRTAHQSLCSWSRALAPANRRTQPPTRWVQSSGIRAGHGRTPLHISGLALRTPVRQSSSHPSPLPNPSHTSNHSSMSPTDRTPLLENGDGANGYAHRLSRWDRFVNLFTVPDDQPGWLQSFKFFLFGSWMNVLLVFVPLSFVSHHLNWDAALRFSFSFIAIMPLAKVISRVFSHRDMGPFALIIIVFFGGL